MDDGLGGLSASTDAREIVEVTAADANTFGLECSGGSVGPGEPGDLMSGGEKFIDGGGTDPSGGSGDENAHGTVSFDSVTGGAADAMMSVTDVSHRHHHTPIRQSLSSLDSA
jgi:hypothetical protein